MIERVLLWILDICFLQGILHKRNSCRSLSSASLLRSPKFLMDWETSHSLQNTQLARLCTISWQHRALANSKYFVTIMYGEQLLCRVILIGDMHNKFQLLLTFLCCWQNQFLRSYQHLHQVLIDLLGPYHTTKRIAMFTAHFTIVSCLPHHYMLPSICMLSHNKK